MARIVIWSISHTKALNTNLETFFSNLSLSALNLVLGITGEDRHLVNQAPDSTLQTFFSNLSLSASKLGVWHHQQKTVIWSIKHPIALYKPFFQSLIFSLRTQCWALRAKTVIWSIGSSVTGQDRDSAGSGENPGQTPESRKDKRPYNPACHVTQPRHDSSSSSNCSSSNTIPWRSIGAWWRSLIRPEVTSWRRKFRDPSWSTLCIGRWQLTNFLLDRILILSGLFCLSTIYYLSSYKWHDMTWKI